MWIVPVTIVLLIAVIVLMPKHITWREIFYTWAVIGFLAWVGDVYISAILDLYDIGPTPEPTLIDIFAISMIPAEFAIIFLNFLPRYNRMWFYAIIWILLTFLFEWYATYTGYIDNSKGWKTWYSLPGYAFVYLFFLRWHLNYLRKELG